MKFNTGETSEELRAQYNPEGSVLYQVQQRMLDMLLYVDSICQQEGIRYCLDGGNVLGAVRHEGFIPWDDDVDIILERSEYDRLCQYLLEHPHPQYKLQTPTTDPLYLSHWNVLRDTHSEYVKDSKIHQLKKYKGVQIDFFPLDKNLFFWVQTLVYKLHKINEKHILGRWNHLAKSLFGWETRCLIPFAIRFSKTFKSKHQDCLTYGYGTYYRWSKWQYPEQVIFPTHSLKFEGKIVQGPADPQTFLKIHYGDYSQLPPVEKRNHHDALAYKIW